MAIGHDQKMGLLINPAAGKESHKSGKIGAKVISLVEHMAKLFLVGSGKMGEASAKEA